jgi:hypothetical protein
MGAICRREPDFGGRPRPGRERGWRAAAIR